MEIGHGVFVSSIHTEDWRFDPEVGGEFHVLVQERTAYAGLERFGADRALVEWTLPERETILVLEGAARIEIQGGPTLELGVGDLASMPQGAVTRWQLTTPYKEVWFFGRPYESDSDGS